MYLIYCKYYLFVIDRKPCDSNEYQCLNYQCIPSSMFCDGYGDCLDGSDEPSYCGGQLFILFKIFLLW